MSQNKGGNPNMSFVRDDNSERAPPSYAEAITSGPRSNPISPVHSGPRPTQSSLEHLLRSLPLQVRRARQDQLSHRKDDEHLLVEDLTPYLAEFLHNLPASVLHPQIQKLPLSAELILLPADAVPATQGWILSDLDQRRISAHVQVVEVTPPGKEKLDFSDQKRSDALADTLGEDRKDLLWWRNEDLADRLASTIRCYLEPEKKAGPELHMGAIYGDNGVHKAQKGDVVRHKGFTPRDESHASTGHKVLGSQSRSGKHIGDRDDDAGVIKATIKAEQVAFRRENDMGLWESSSGWALVLEVKVAT